MKSILLDRRSKEILTLLAESRGPLTTSYIGNKLNVSSRTVKRQMVEVEDYLKKHGFKFLLKPGYGMEIQGDLSEKNRLKQLIKEEEVEKRYTPEERQLFILIELLKSKEPIKMYKFKSDLNVTEGTISLDLDKIEASISKYKIDLIRKPGLGVYIEGDESEIRKLIIDMIYENDFQKQVLEILGEAIQNKDRNTKSIRLSAQDKLLNMIDKDTIKEIERIVAEFENEKRLELNDSQYVGLVIHLALVVERIKNGDNICMDKSYLKETKKKEEFNIAKELASQVEKSLGIELPEDEVGYITIHLLGSRKYFDYESKDLNDFFIDNYRIIKTAKALIQYVESKSNINLLQDDKILINLAIHLEPAIKRMLMGMDIRNPLLDEIIRNYPQLFNLTKKASFIIEEEFNVKVPDAEVGYIALHIGGALERVNNPIYKVIVICPSGIGVSRLLSTKISNEFLNIEVVDRGSAFDLEKFDLSSCDFIITTVPINANDIPWVLVNPLLLEEDIENIKATMARLPLEDMEIKDIEIKEESLRKRLEKNINYSKAIIQILDNYSYHELAAEGYEDLIDLVVKSYSRGKLGFTRLKKDIVDREKLGQIILEESGTIILHCRTSEVEKLQLGIFKLLNPLVLKDIEIKTAVILLAPKKIEAEYLEIMSYLTQSIFKGELTTSSDKDEMERNLNRILENFYKNIK